MLAGAAWKMKSIHLKLAKIEKYQGVGSVETVLRAGSSLVVPQKGANSGSPRDASCVTFNNMFLNELGHLG